MRALLGGDAIVAAIVLVLVRDDIAMTLRCHCDCRFVVGREWEQQLERTRGIIARCRGRRTVAAGPIEELIGLLCQGLSMEPKLLFALRFQNKILYNMNIF